MIRTPTSHVRALVVGALASTVVACASGTALPERRPGADGGRNDAGGRPGAGDPADAGTPDSAAPDTATGSDAATEPDVDAGAADASTGDAVDASAPDTAGDTVGTGDAAGDAADTALDTALPDADAVDSGATDAVDAPGELDAGPDDVAAECFNGTTEPCYGGSPALAGVGVCSRGERTCTAGRWGACVGWVAPAATETCDNGLDDNCSGVVDEGCAVACGVRPTRLISNIENDDIHALFTAAGLTVSEPFSINNTHFAGNDVVLVDALYLSSTVTPSVIRDFLNRGGSVVFLTTSLQTSCNRIQNDNLASTGLGLRCSSSSPTGPVTSLGSHPLTAGLSAGQFPAPYASEVIGGTAIASISAIPIAAALEEGCGRMVVIGSSDVADAYYWPVQRAFWQNVVTWMATPR